MILDKLLKVIFDQLFALTSNYGVSIILLSLAVTVIMLPLFWYAEKLQKKERTRKAIMQPALDKIKNLTNKQEKYYYTKEIYRKNGYKSYYSLTGLIGLAIQVPFFIAAYIMLKDYTDFKGVSFGPIRDLFQPDAIVTMGSLSINLLPVLMTIVNLIGVGMQRKNMERSEATQLSVIAFVFLILLYKLSAALVLYWTMNNVFALGKNWLLSEKNKVNVEPIGVAELFRRNVHYGIVMLSVITVLFLIGIINAPAGVVATKNILMRVALAVFCCSIIFVQALKSQDIYSTQALSLKRVISISIITSITVLLAGILVFGSVLWAFSMTGEVRHFSDVGIMLRAMILWSGSLLSIFGLMLYFHKSIASNYKRTIAVLFPERLRELREDKKELNSVIAASLLLCATVLITLPIQLFLSEPEDFDVQPHKVFLPFILQIMFVVGVLWLVVTFAFKKKRLIASVLTIFSFLLMLSLNTPTPDWGLLKDFIFDGYTTLPVPVYQSRMQLLLMALFTLFALYFLYYRRLIQKVAKYISILLFFIILGMVGQTFFSYIQVRGKVSFRSDEAQVVSPIRLSKNKNTVIFFADAFTGNAMAQLIEEYPQLKVGLDGFTFFADAISQGSWTWNGTPGILGGHAYTPLNFMDENGEIHPKPLESSTEKFVDDFVDSFDELNFYGPHQFNRATETEKVKRYILAGFDKSKEIKNLRSKLFIITLFKAIPLRFKDYMYNEGKWRGVPEVDLSTDFGSMGEIYNRYQTVDAISNIELTEADNACSFVFTKLTHGPFYVDKKCNWTSIAATPYWNEQGSLNSAHFVVKKISEFIDKAKRKGVYENMQVIIVSDHGHYGIPKKLTKDEAGLLASEYFKWYDAVLMVKQPNSKGLLHTDTTTFLSNADVPGFIRANIENRNEEFLKEMSVANRKLIHVAQYGRQQKQTHIEMNGTSLNTNKWRVLRNDYEK